MKKPRAVTATTSGTPPLSSADAFARMLAAAQEKRPDLRIVVADELEDKQWKPRRIRGRAA